MKTCLTSLLSGKCKSKVQCGITSHWLEWPSSKSLETVNAGEGVEKRDMENSMEILKKLRMDLPYDPVIPLLAYIQRKS